MEQITEALKEQFARNIGLVIQQEGSKLRKFVTNETQDTEVIQFETMHTHDRVGRHQSAFPPKVGSSNGAVGLITPVFHHPPRQT